MEPADWLMSLRVQRECGKGSINMGGWVFVAIPAVALVILLVHDFMAGLGEDRLWADPASSDSGSFRSRAVKAERMHPDSVSMDSIGKLEDFLERDEDGPATAEESQKWPA